MRVCILANLEECGVLRVLGGVQAMAQKPGQPTGDS